MALIRRFKKLCTAHGDRKDLDLTTPPPAPSGTFSNDSGKIAIQGNVHVERDQNIFITQSSWRHVGASVIGSPSDMSFTEDEQHYLSRLRPVPIYGREASIEENSPGTLTWLRQDMLYDSWHSSSTSQILLLTGHAGSGKSVLSSFVHKTLSDSAPPATVICRYYFDGTVSDQADVHAMLRSLVYQIIIARRKLLKLAKRVMDEHKQLSTDKGALWRLFQTLATHQQVRSLVIIVDAIDECPQDSQEWFVQHLNELLCLKTTTIRAFVTSRPNCDAVNALETSGSPVSHLKLETRQCNVDKDIGTFIQEHVGRLVRNGNCANDSGAMLERLLRDKAEGSFLWISLALSLLRQRRFLRRADCLRVAQNLPSGLMDMYRSLLQAIPEDEHLLASKTICFIATCQRNLTIHEMDTMLAVDQSHQSVAEVSEDSTFSRTQEVESLLRGLVRTSHSRIALIHRTLKEYLELCASEETALGGSLLFKDTKSSHRLVAECCMRYILLKDFECDLFSDSAPSTPAMSDVSSFDTDIVDGTSPESAAYLKTLFREPEEITGESVASIGHRYKLFDYAARYWPFHFSQVQHDCSVELQKLALILCEFKGRRNWFRYVSVLGHDHNEYPVDPDALTLACFLGRLATAKALLAGHNDDVSSPALYWAANNGHASCVAALLSAKPYHHSWASVRGRSPLVIAATRGRTTCIEIMLLEKTFCVNGTDLSGRTPLSTAAEGLHLETVDRILSEECVDVNLADHTGATPLFWAVGRDSLQLVRRLLDDKRTRSDCIDSRQRTALSWACEYGSADLVRLVARREKSLLNQADIQGRTPLMYAAMFGNLDVVKYLVHCGGIEVSQQDNEGRNVISWAAQQSNVGVLEYLLKINPLSAQTTDAHGWSPFAWTMDPPERLTNAIAMISRVPEACFESGSGLNMFVLAVSWGSFKIARLLVSRETFSINETSPEGRTAIWYAAEAGHVGLVRQLLAVEDIDVNIADSRGMTAYSVAAAGHHDEICRLMQQAL